MADRIVLLRNGKIEQTGAPLELFERPATRYVAGFLGSPSMNFIPATVVGTGQGVALKLSDGVQLPMPATRTEALAPWRDKAIELGLRPEHFSPAAGHEQRTGLAELSVLVELLQPTGSRTYASFRIGETEVTAELQAHDVTAPNETVRLMADMNRAVLIDPASEKVLQA